MGVNQHIFFGPEGEQRNTYDGAGDVPHKLGQLMIIEDRWYRYVLMGATAAIAGNLYQSEVPGANLDELVVPTAVALGAREMVVTNGATAIVANDFDYGYLNLDDDAGEGRLHRVVDHTAGAGSAAITLKLHPDDTIDEALTAATTVTLLKNPWKKVVIHPSPPTALVVGVAVSDIPADDWGWLQIRGPCSVLIGGTVVIGMSVMASATVNGAVEAWATTGVSVGRVMEVAADTEYGAIFLSIE